jgi:endonuclease I
MTMRAAIFITAACLITALACGSGNLMLHPDTRTDPGQPWPDTPDEPGTIDAFDDAGPDGDAATPEDAAEPGPDPTDDPDLPLDDTSPPDPGPVDPGPGDPGGPDLVPDPGFDAPAQPDVLYTGKYAGLENTSGQSLVDALCAIVKDGYKTIGYSEAGDLIRQEVDSYNGQVQCAYEGLWHKNGNGLNIEHSWPQSLGAEGVAKSDMFHLFPTVSKFNSARGNLPFGEVVDRDWPEDLTGDANCAVQFSPDGLGCYSVRGKDLHDVKVFEPRDGHKGNAARAVLYFSLRYGSNCKVKPLKTFDEDHPAVTEALLKQWNLLDPPDSHEKDRNDRIEKYQKVRNPFVDHPEFVDRISFQ